MSSKKAKKRGLIGRILRKAYINMLHNGIDPEKVREEYSKFLNHHIKMDTDPVYRQEYLTQHMIDQIAENQANLTHRVIDQGMTWLLPRLERDFEEIIRELKDK